MNLDYQFLNTNLQNQIPVCKKDNTLWPSPLGMTKKKMKNKEVIFQNNKGHRELCPRQLEMVRGVPAHIKHFTKTDHRRGHTGSLNKNQGLLLGISIPVSIFPWEGRVVSIPCLPSFNFSSKGGVPLLTTELKEGILCKAAHPRIQAWSWGTLSEPSSAPARWEPVVWD